MFTFYIHNLYNDVLVNTTNQFLQWFTDSGNFFSSWTSVMTISKLNLTKSWKSTLSWTDSRVSFNSTDYILVFFNTINIPKNYGKHSKSQSQWMTSSWQEYLNRITSMISIESSEKFHMCFCISLSALCDNLANAGFKQNK